MQLMSVFTSSCFSRCPQQKCPFPVAFRAIYPTLVLLVIFVKRSRCCPRIFAAKQQQEADKPVKKSGKRRAPKNPHLDGYDEAFELEARAADRRSSHPSPLPKPPAGFVLNDHGRVLLASNKRIATIVDATNNLPLECVVRRVFQSSQGDECMLLCPVDTPVQILRSTNFNGWSAVNDDEVEAIIPSAAYALAKIHMHLVVSGFCYTARGGFFYSEEDIIEFRTDDGEEIDGLPTEGLEITCFNLDGTHYMIYTPSDPLLFVAIKDTDGNLQIAEDRIGLVACSKTWTYIKLALRLARDLLEDPAIVGAIDEETEFNALVINHANRCMKIRDFLMKIQ